MPYQISFTDTVNKGSITVEDETINNETSLSIPGKKRRDYGQLVGENFLHLLENFASPTEPPNPVEGQLWYDNTDGIDQLKIYDGTTWSPAGGIKKSTNQPSVSNSIAGDLWVNTNTQQLYLFSGSGWVLVGPQFSDGLLTGTQSQIIVGTDDVEYSTLVIKIRDAIVSIISPANFTPKSTIIGFPNGIKAGFNISTNPTITDQPYKYYGTSEKSENLVVNNITVPATNFLRSDQESTINHRLNIKNNNGLQIGDNNQIGINVSNQSAVMQNNISGSAFDIRMRSGNRFYNVIRVDSTQKVGINTLSPEQDLQVDGNVLIKSKTDSPSSGYLEVSSVIESTSLDTGSIITNGGAAISLNCNVGGNLQVNGSTQTSDIIPDSTGSRNIGSSTRKYNQIYATTLFANVQGDVTGTLTGRSTNADRLTSPTTFSISGDVTPASFVFDGQTGGTTKTFNIQISNSFISNKTRTFDASENDEILINKVSGDTGIYKISKQNFLKTLQLNPPGIIVPFGGILAPTGWLLCDGSEVLKTDYPLLWEVIGYNFKDPALLSDQGLNTFALPDFRGRFALGMDNMGGTSANRVIDVSANSVGGTNGNENITVGIENLPEHTHDLQGSDGSQFYAIRESNLPPSDPNAIAMNIESGTGGTQGLTNSGGISTDGNLGESISVMNPYTTVNYIIYTGQ